jgi:hypothetical protein
MEWSLAWVALGGLAFTLWARKERIWPFGDKEIQEQYAATALDADKERLAA